MDAIRPHLDIQIQKRRMLRLPTCASVMEDHYARDLPRLSKTEITLHEAECQVDAGGHDGRRSDLPVGDNRPDPHLPVLLDNGAVAPGRRANARSRAVHQESPASPKMKAPMQIDAMRLALAEARCRKSITSKDGLAISGGAPTRSVSSTTSAPRSVSTRMPNEFTSGPPDNEFTSGPPDAGYAVHVVESFTKDHIRRLECEGRRKAQIRKPWREHKTDGYDDGLQWAGCCGRLKIFQAQS